MKRTKQITYLSAVIILIGSVIGAGIFFKNATIFKNAGGSIGFLIASWIVGGIGVIAIGVALVEVSSGVKDNSGMLGWLRKFAGPKASKYGTAYMLLILMPINYLTLPIYAAMSLQDAGLDLNEWLIAIVAFSIFLWITITAFLSMRFGEVSQWIYTFIKFIPLIAIFIISLVQSARSGVVSNIDKSTTGLTNLSPWLGIMASIPAILFAMDGFYTVTNLRGNLKDEKKLGSIIAVGVSIVIGIYILYATITALPGVGFLGLDIVKNNQWISSVFNIMIMFAIMGIVNGFAISATNFYQDTEKMERIGVISFMQNKFKIKSPRNAAFLGLFLMSILLYVVLVPIGIYGVESSYGEDYQFNGQNIGSLYTLCDMLTNFTSLLVFVIIAVSIVGGIINRRTNKIKVTKIRFFIPIAYTAVIFILIGSAYMLIETIVNMTGFRGADATTSIINFAIMITILVISGLPIVLDAFRNKKPKKLEKVSNRL